MSHNESDTRSNLIDPAINARGWTEDHIKGEESAGTIEILAGKAKRNAKGKVDYSGVWTLPNRSRSCPIPLLFPVAGLE